MSHAPGTIPDTRLLVLQHLGDPSPLYRTTNNCHQEGVTFPIEVAHDPQTSRDVEAIPSGGYSRLSIAELV